MKNLIPVMLLWVVIGNFCLAQDITGTSNKNLLHLDSPNEQIIPLITATPDGASARCHYLRLKWDPLGIDENDNTIPQFIIHESIHPEQAHALRSQLWLSALAAAIVSQESWRRARWQIGEISLSDERSIGAALSIALIATATGLPVPTNTTIMGGLNFDNSLASVSGLEARMRAAAREGIKRVVIPVNQRLEESGNGVLINAEATAQALGLELLIADDLAEAVQQVLECQLPVSAELMTLPRYSREIFLLLDRECRQEQDFYQKNRTVLEEKPNGTAGWQTLFPYLVQKIRKSFEVGLEAYKSGQLYAAKRHLCQANAGLSSLATLNHTTNTPNLQIYNIKARWIREKFNQLLNHEKYNKNELNTSLVVAQKSDWIYGLNELLSGSQLVALEASGSRTEATKMQRELSQAAFFYSSHAVEYLMQQEDDFEELYNILKLSSEVPVYDRGSKWLPQLVLIHLLQAQFFAMGLQNRAQELQRDLVWDRELAAYSRFLKSAIQTRYQLPELVRLDEATEPITVAATIGFQPSSAYFPARPKMQTQEKSNISDIARCLDWINGNSHVAVLEQKYLRFKGGLNPQTLEWSITNNAAFSGMLRFADLGARRGIALAARAGVNISMLALSYEWASNLRESESDNDHLEALRQFWRCGLIGSLCWQLAYTPKAKIAAPNPEPVVESPPEDEEDKEKEKEESSSISTNSPTNQVIETNILSAPISLPEQTNQTEVIEPAIPPRALPTGRIFQEENGETETNAMESISDPSETNSIDSSRQP